MDDRLFLGNNALTGHKLKIPFDELKRHWHFLGRTGKGKTKALEIFCRHIIDAQHPLILLDGKGDLFEAVLSYCALCEDPQRVVIVDPTHQDWVCGINYLEALGDTLPAGLAETVVDGLKKCFGEEDEFKPLLEEWTPPAIIPLIEEGFTLAELEEFASIASPNFRLAVLDQMGGRGERIKRKWFELTRAYGTHQAAERTAVVRTRASLINQNPIAQAIFGQQKTTINWRSVIDTDGIVLVRSHTHPKISRRLKTLLGTTIIHQLIQTAHSRPKGERRDAWVVCDEFQQFACEDFKEALSQMRSFKLWFVLSNQELHQLDCVCGLKEQVIAECTGKVYFSISHKDAEETVHELFQEDIHGEKIKDEIKQTKFRPVESTREVHSITHSESHGESETTTESDTFCNVDSSGEVVSSGSSVGLRFSFDDYLLGGAPGGVMAGGSDTFAKSGSHCESAGASESTSYGSSSSTSDSQGKAIVPWYEYEEFFETSSRTYYTLEEIIERCKTWLMVQDTRRAQLKVGDRKTLPIVTRYLDDVPILPEEIDEFIRQVMPHCARPFEEVQQEISERVRLFVESYETEKEKEAAARTIEPPKERIEPALGFARTKPVVKIQRGKNAS